MRQGIGELRERGFARQQGRPGALFGEPPRFGNGVAQGALELARCRGYAPLAQSRPAALDAPHAHRAG
ncbi:MAG: hypothetical protein ACREME_02425, partial [Gemmatimonadales bacterium]